MIRKRKNTFLIVFLLFFLILLILPYFESYLYLQKTVSTEGYIKMNISDIIIRDNVAFIKHEGEHKELIFVTTPEQAISIKSGISDQIILTDNS